MPLPSVSRRYRPARVTRLFGIFYREHDRLCAKLNRAVDEVAREVLDNRQPLNAAVVEARRRYLLDPDNRVVVHPDGLVRTRMVEALILAGRPRDAARLAAGILPAYPAPIPGGSVFLCTKAEASWLLEGRQIPIPAERRIDLGPL